MASRTPDIVWSPEAVTALEAIRSRRKSARIVHRVTLAATNPGLHRPRPTATWGTVYLFTESPFIVVYRFRNSACEVLDIVDAKFMASFEIKE